MRRRRSRRRHRCCRAIRVWETPPTRRRRRTSRHCGSRRYRWNRQQVETPPIETTTCIEPQRSELLPSKTPQSELPPIETPTLLPSEPLPGDTANETTPVSERSPLQITTLPIEPLTGRDAYDQDDDTAAASSCSRASCYRARCRQVRRRRSRRRRQASRCR